MSEATPADREAAFEAWVMERPNHGRRWRKADWLAGYDASAARVSDDQLRLLWLAEHTLDALMAAWEAGRPLDQIFHRYARDVVALTVPDARASTPGEGVGDALVGLFRGLAELVEEEQRAIGQNTRPAINGDEALRVLCRALRRLADEGEQS